MGQTPKTPDLIRRIDTIERELRNLRLRPGGGDATPVDNTASTQLRWYDPFNTDQLVTEYTDVRGFSVSGGVLDAGLAGGVGCYAVKTGNYFDCAQQIKVTLGSPGGVGVGMSPNDGVSLVSRVSPSGDHLTALWLPQGFNSTTGKFVISSNHSSSIFYTRDASFGGAQANFGETRWIKSITHGETVWMGIFDSDPVSATQSNLLASFLSADLAINLGSGPTDYLMFALDSAVGIGVISSSMDNILLDDYRVWQL